MTARKRKHVPPSLWSVFDTNAVYTGSASYLLRKEIVDLIKDNSGHPDLNTRWVIPAIVKHERQYQMQREAEGFLPTVNKLERLLGHNLNIPSDILLLRVEEAINRQLTELRVDVIDLDIAKTAWERIILDAVYRRAPFEDGKNEKGFRDALVLESYIQLVEEAPQNPKSCRVCLVTGDERLRAAAEERVKGLANARLFSSTDELRGLINTLVSQVDETFVQDLMPQASKLFFVVKDEETLYYSSNLSNAMRLRLSGDIGVLPRDADSYEITGYLVSQPQFVKKERQTITWSSRVEVEVDLKKKEVRIPPWQTSLSPPITGARPLQLGSLGDALGHEVSKVTRVSEIQPLLLWGTESKVVGSGRAAYDAVWTTVVNTAGKLTRPHFERIDFTEVVWS